MVRGTTPKLEFIIPFNTDIIMNLYITFNQVGENVLEKTENDCNFEENTIVCHLTQADTLMFNEKNNVSIQIRIKTIDGESLASNIINESVKKVLKDGEI